MIFITTENSKTNEPHKFVLSLSQRLDLGNRYSSIVIEGMWTIFLFFKYILEELKATKNN